MHLLYNEKSIIGRLFSYFAEYFENYSAPTIETLFLLILSIFALESAKSIRSLYKHFLVGITDKSLNSFYYACSYAKIDCSSFMNTSARIALRLIPEYLKSNPVFISVDDTMISKHGKHFENVSILFDHAQHNGSNYLNGHCFVSIMLCVPVWNKDKIKYLSIPLGYRMWDKDTSKLALAASMIRTVMPELNSVRKVIILCDSWYVKKDFVSITNEFDNLELIGNARIDSVIYDIAPEKTGKRGRPAKHGKRLSVNDDFTMSNEKIGDFHVSSRKVLTNIFGDKPVVAYVTMPSLESKSRRLFFSTVMPYDIQIFCAWQEKYPLNHTGSDRMVYIPLMLYQFRWNIEVSYYEQKSFWSLCSYMVRSQKGIETLINLINIGYSAMKMLPYIYDDFASYRGDSTQDFRYMLSTKIREQVFLMDLIQNTEKYKKSDVIYTALKQAFSKVS